MGNPQITQIGPEHAGTRLDVYLASQFAEWSRARLQKLIENEDVLVNGRVAKPSYKLREHDEVEVELSAPPSEFFTPENIPLVIV
jgi:23S rRNA pseudouridine1911/1915/1917 synthase